MKRPRSLAPEPAGPAGARDPREAFARAEALQHAGRWEDAERVYRGLLRTHPDHAAVLHNLGLVLKAQGQLDEAAATLRRAIAAEPREAALYNALGGIQGQQRRPDLAEGSYRKAIELWPSLPEAHYNLGVVLEGTGRTADALAPYREAVRLQPAFGKARTRLAALLREQGALDEALAQLDQAVAAAPEYFDGHYYRGWVLSDLKRHGEAAAALARARELRPDSFEALIASANALRDGGRLDEALALYGQAVEMRPDHAPTHEDFNKLAHVAGRDDLYLRSFARARERLGEEPDLLHLEAAFHVRRSDWRAAEALLARARQLAPSRGDIAGLYARALAGQGRFEESYPHFGQAIGAEPGEMRHRHEFGFALLRDGQAAEALKVFKRAYELVPHDQLVLAGLLLAFRQLGDSQYHQFVDYGRFVRVYDLDVTAGHADNAAFNRALAAELDALHTAKVEPIDQTLRGGTQTTGRLFGERSPAIQAVREAIDAAVEDYVKAVSAMRAADGGAPAFHYSGSWSCRLAAGGYHSNHVHPRGRISSAYYARLPAIGDASRHEGWLKFGESNYGLGERDRPESFVEPRVGRLVLFPSYYWHGTVPFSTGGDRLGLAFDAVPTAPAAASPAPPPAPETAPA